MVDRLWVDDKRLPPDEEAKWDHATTVVQAIEMMTRSEYPIVSLDYSMGSMGATTEPILEWWDETSRWPLEVRLHSSDFVARMLLKEIIKDLTDRRPRRPWVVL